MQLHRVGSAIVVFTRRQVRPRPRWGGDLGRALEQGAQQFFGTRFGERRDEIYRGNLGGQEDGHVIAGTAGKNDRKKKVLTGLVAIKRVADEACLVPRSPTFG